MLAHRTEIIDEIERRRYALNLSLLKIYSYYRLLIGLGLATVFLQDFMGSGLGVLDPTGFLRLTLGYSAINVLSVIVLQVIPRRHFHAQEFASVLAVYDIVALAALMYFSGGVGSGIGLLMLVSVATGAILVTGRRALALASLAAIAILYQEFHVSLAAPQLHDDYFQAGVLGAMCFAAAIALQYLSQRVRDNDIRALTQAAELADLERVNRQVIARMRTGIVVVDAANRVRLANQAARGLLGVPVDDDLPLLPAVLEGYLNDWRQDTSRRAPPFQVGPDTPEIRANFAPVRSDDPGADVTIFLEDTAEIQQQAQQLKLAALGRLSASIAHEIRNPLGAVSHAAQLLRESQSLEPGDHRLTEIIGDHCKRMNGVVENVLETSRRRLPTPVRLNLRQHLEAFACTYREAQSDAQIEVHVDPADTEIRMDKSQLDQVLTNLVSNAIRHSSERSGRPWVRLEGGIDSRTERPYLNVIDEGTGVPEEALEKLFEPFYTTARTGTGLGLYLSRELCEANQARLTYYRHEHAGACFRVSFTHPDRIIA
ncbi:MAG: ATP-binding protein [Gammaproteobacteria bacterium]|nr:ATP-binding protein [Gammaproteobacteria bacterium]